MPNHGSEYSIHGHSKRNLIRVQIHQKMGRRDKRIRSKGNSFQGGTGQKESTYPQPIVDHKRESEMTKTYFSRIL